ncbi:MAG: hypothetical protein SGI92_13665 [Bryobacteraceae bacterium]|nr:hypothetical protein [Bryobacteraceae bacterium]
MLALCVAVVLGIAGLPSRKTMEASGTLVGNEVRKRAAIRLYDDFHNNLDAWVPAASNVKNKPAAWASQNGFIQPGPLRLWSETQTLKDYQFEFAAEIRQKAVSWAFRASDAANLYACRLEVVRPGPLPEVEFVRFTRAGGIASKPVRRRLPLTVRADTVYEVKMQVRDSDFLAAVNGVIVDTWSDNTHSKGGVGFWSDAGETASLRYASIRERDDFTGRVLADILQPADKK